jgi:hypothetical protein
LNSINATPVVTKLERISAIVLAPSTYWKRWRKTSSDAIGYWQNSKKEVRTLINSLGKENIVDIQFGEIKTSGKEAEFKTLSLETLE